MADEFITDLDAITTFSDTDLVVVETDPTGTPETNKMTVANWITNYLRRVTWTITRTVASNNMTVALKDCDGNDATAAKPLTFIIDGTPRKLSGALSLTVNAGTNTWNLGSTENKNNSRELFVYAGYRAASATVFLLLSRMPHIREYADFSTTATSERYGAYTGSAPAATDKVTVIGRVNIQNSGTASYNWSLPTPDVIVNKPVHETSWGTWTPVPTASGSLTYGTVTFSIARYRMVGDAGGMRLEYAMKSSGTLGGSASNILYFTLPFESAQVANVPNGGSGATAAVAAIVNIAADTPDKLAVYKYDQSNYATSGTCVVNISGFFEV